MNKRKFVAPRLKAGGAPSQTAPAAGPVAKRPAPKPKLALVGAQAADTPNSLDGCCPNVPQAPFSEAQTLCPAAAPPAGPTPTQPPPSRRIFRLPVITATSMPSLESLGFDVSLPPAQRVMGNLPKALISDESLIHPAGPGAEALAAVAAALHDSALPAYLDLPQGQQPSVCTVLGLLKLPYESRCRAHVEAMERPTPALPPQPRCAPSDVTGHSIPSTVISAAVWVPTPEAESKPAATAAARRRLVDEAEIPLAALKAMLLG